MNNKGNPCFLIFYEFNNLIQDIYQKYINIMLFEEKKFQHCNYESATGAQNEEGSNKKYFKYHNILKLLF